MSRTRYREERTLARGLHRLPGQEKADFKKNVLRLRRHFEQFNLDVSEICQWLMGIRPEGKRGNDGSELFWKFFLEPENFIKEEEKDNSDKYRRMAFDMAAGIDKESKFSSILAGKDIIESIRKVSEIIPTPTAENLFQRLKGYEFSHRQILLKSAAEWILVRYEKVRENRERQYKEWEKDKERWEKKHPEMTEKIRDDFNEIFERIEIKEENPRVCTWERLKENKNNCLYAGEKIYEKRHSALCVKYKKFLDVPRKGKKIIRKYFPKDANSYLEMKKRNPSLGNDEAYIQFSRKYPKSRWFPEIWEEYLKIMEINESTILNQYGARLPHCVNFGGDNECEFSTHTEKCRLYKAELDKRPDLQEHEEDYREWRRNYLSGPKKPSFRYPSSKGLSVPKIFGENYHEIDYEKSILRLRLDDMPEGKYLDFGYKHWPKKYSPQPGEAEIIIVNINFIGTRGRAAFRFKVKHKASRLSVSQDDIDELRSLKYPREYQDQEFLDECRELLRRNFQGDFEKDLKILAVDIGDKGACAAKFNGNDFQKAIPLKIIKLKKLYESSPENDKGKKEKSNEEKEKDRQRGLTKQHVGRHINDYSEGQKKIAEYSNKEEKQEDKGKKEESDEQKKGIIGSHDMRRLNLHIKWMLRDWVRLNASQIIKIAEDEEADLIVFESMRGFNAPGRHNLDKEKKKTHAFFSYGKIRHKVKEKAVERGMRVVTVPYKKSSQTCSNCGEEQKDKNKCKRKKRDKIFECDIPGCGFKCNSDENAARVLGKVFGGQIKLPVE